MATTTSETTTKSSTRRGFPDLACLGCGEVDTMTVSLDDMLLVCRECGAEFTAADVRSRLETWARVLAWLELAPAVK